MKFWLSVLLAAALINAAPLEIRQSSTVGIFDYEYTVYGCRKIIFFFARGTTEPGNMGDSSGPPTGQGLKNAFGATNVDVQGVDYAALISTNFLPGGADPVGIQNMKNLFNSAASKCPNSILVGGGYSQGAAVVHGAVSTLSDSVKAKIAGIVTYGDTRNKQDNGQIPNFPRDKLLIICNPGDLVCDGTLTITPAHLDYVKRVPEGVSFLIGKINAAKGS